MFGNLSSIDISASGLSAERLRMEITANNIANAHSTISEGGDPYRRQSVVFGAVLDETAKNATQRFGGVEIVGIEGDETEFPVVHNPGHPHADENGFVKLSNVKIPQEMVDLVTSSRAYEANSKAITLFKEMVQQTISLMQGGTR